MRDAMRYRISVSSINKAAQCAAFDYLAELG